MRALAFTALEFFSKRGPLSRALDGYESRPAQVQLAEAVGRTLDTGGLLLAEAGTGTGKTLAYLLPAVELGRRVVISTGTKNLQEQLVQKDIPILARALGRPLRVAVMKGRGNYLCLTRFQSFSTTGRFRRLEEVPFFRAIEKWAPVTRTGDRGEIADLPDQVDFWREISASSENCMGRSCPELDACWITKMRQQALEVDVVVVNHHLLCADLSIKRATDYGSVIPEYDTLVVDEAHLLEDVATAYFGVQISGLRVEELCRDVDREVAAAVVDAPEVLKEAQGLRVRGSNAFSLVPQEAGRRLKKGWMPPVLREEMEGLLKRLAGLRTALLALPEAPEPVRALADRAQALAADLSFLVAAEDTAHVFFVEVRGRFCMLRATPIDVASRLTEFLWGRLRAGVLTSATLAVDGTLDHLRSRLGLPHEAEELILPSPFDYATQSVLYVPRRMPEPRDAQFVDRATDEVERLLDLSRGRAFVLFTSYANLNAVAQRLAGRVPWPLFVQGEAPRSTLVETFRNTPNAVLLATSSFWQGVDVAGEQLSCVVVDKLPFASPGDPVVAARVDRINAEGGNAFSEYQVPVAVLTLKQGLGRLIRSASDCGVLAVLDSRLIEKSYGRRFLDSLPPARLVHEMDEVESFWAGVAARDPRPAPRTRRPRK